MKRPSDWLREPSAHALLLAGACLLAYADTFHVPFTFDDQRCIVSNPAIRGFASFANPALARSLPSSLQCGFATRIVGHFTFALNFRLGGLDVAGYHLFNLAVHLANALLVYLLVKLSSRTPLFESSTEGTESRRPPAASSFVPLFSALLFACHPVQTQAVTYVTQRFTSLATFFYLLAVILYAGFRLSAAGARRWILFVAALMSSVLAMMTKEISFTLPAVLALYEITFLRGRAKMRLLSLFPFFLTLPIIPLLLGMPRSAADAGELDASLKALAGNVPVTRFEWVLTQLRVVATYLRLFFLPIGQNLDYDYPIHRSLADVEVLLSLLLLLAVLAAGALLYVRSHRRGPRASPDLALASFGIFWFLVTLIVESGIVPLADVIFEHRMYLPSVGLFTAVATLAFAVRERLAIAAPSVARLTVPLLSAAIFLLGFATYARNEVWGDEVRLWEDVARKSPMKVRAHMELGALHAKSGRLEEATREILTAIRLRPDYADAYNSLGVIRRRQGLFDEAMASYLTALRLRPDYAEVHRNVGLLLAAAGHVPEAVREIQEAVRLRPDYAEAHNSLGVLYAQQGQMDAATREFEATLRLAPGHAGARSNLEKAFRSGRAR